MFRVYSLVVAFLLVGLSSGNSLWRQRLQDRSDPRDKSCALADVENFIADNTECIGLSQDGEHVSHRGVCPVGFNNSDASVTAVAVNLESSDGMLTCLNGHWTDSTIGARRQKRFVSVLIAIGITALVASGITVCVFLCFGSKKGNTPPQFTEPCTPANIQSEYFTPSGSRAAVVTWDPPSVTDGEDDVTDVSVELVSGSPSGSSFQGSTAGKNYFIVYKATDTGEASASCYFQFTVTIRTCSPLSWLVNGIRTCDNPDNIVGTVCQHSCNDGYELTGSSTITCGSEPTPIWSGLATCQKIKCPRPDPPPNGFMSCTDPNYEYQTICTVKCDPGFGLGGQLYTRCMADRSWSGLSLIQCIDNRPPEITCVTLQVFYADRGVTTTSVNWTLPAVIDNVDMSPELVQTDGPSLGADLEVGSAFVKYKAVDSEDNESPECRIELRVEEITCEHPLDTFDDSRLKFNCTGSGYTYGTHCIVSCLLNLPLEGATVISCEDNGLLQGVWDWGAENKSNCRDIACSELNAPINGALVYDEVLTRPVYTMMCSNQYDIPSMGFNFNGMFFCGDDGDWNPSVVPDCVVARNPRFLTLPGEIFYYSGECGTNETMQEIEDNYQEILNSDINAYFKTVCPKDEVCLAENIVIKCGPIKPLTRRKRHFNRGQYKHDSELIHSLHKREDSHVLSVNFDITVELNLDNTSFVDQIGYYDDIVLNILKPTVKELLDNGTMDIPGFSLREDSFRTPDLGDIMCPTGTTISSDFSKCYPCPLGTYLDSGKCVQCQVGYYSDVEGQAGCKKCPEGFSTKQNGSKFPDDCKELCRPGTYSPDTMESCSVCRHGFYQDEAGQPACKRCPLGTTTVLTNSTSADECTYFDIELMNSNGSELLISSVRDISHLSIMFWVKLGALENTSAALFVSNNATDILKIQLASEIEVITRFDQEQVGRLGSAAWTHVAVTWDGTDSSFSAFVNGIRVYRNASDTPFQTDCDLLFVSQGGIYLTGFHVRNSTLDDNTAANMASSCFETGSDDIVTMETFSSINARRIVPSKCFAFDFCSVSPCNGHKCVNGYDNYTCQCYDGWTGETCSNPPDYCPGNECTNGATCQSGTLNYTCTCLPGFSGLFCDIAPVNGDWSDWMEWSECTATCGSGSRTRDRSCDSPPPDPLGEDCHGNRTETERCNPLECPACPEMSRKFGTHINCTTNDLTGTEKCVLTCSQDKSLPPGSRNFVEYKCGLETNYQWDPVDVFPECVGARKPRNLKITTGVAYTSPIQQNDQETVKSDVRSKAEHTPCFNSTKCTASINISNATKRRKRNAGSSLTITFEIPLELGPELDLGMFLDNGTVSDSLEEFMTAVVLLEQTAQYLQNYTDRVFDIDNGTVSYTVDPGSLEIDGDVQCAEGEVTVDGACLECPSGTYKTGGICSFCDRGTYQPNTGQTYCTICPSGYTSRSIGATNVSECTVKCPDGTFWSNGTCTPCRKGYFQSDEGQESCVQCEDGFTTKETGSVNSSQCSVEDHCLNNTCINSATCESTGENYTCHCLPGYSGTFCEISPVDGNWSEWATWTDCSATCGLGSKSRARTCNNPPPDLHGNDCVGEASETADCNSANCPVDGLWSDWLEWNACSVTCDSGTQTRGRTCDNPEPSAGGNQCVGSAVEEQNCNIQICPVDGSWSEWLEWNTCTVPCGSGTQTRGRTCDNPEPSTGGNQCVGSAVEEQTCNTQICSVDGSWSEWLEWNACSATCDSGTQTRERTCDNPEPSVGGNQCVGSAVEEQSCNTEQCPGKKSTTVAAAIAGGTISFALLIIVVGICIMKARKRQRVSHISGYKSTKAKRSLEDYSHSSTDSQQQKGSNPPSSIGYYDNLGYKDVTAKKDGNALPFRMELAVIPQRTVTTANYGQSPQYLLYKGQEKGTSYLSL